MKKLFIIVFVGIFAALSANAQLLYRISGKGLQKPSYILGTFHLADVSFVDSIQGIREALANTDQVYGELDMNDMLSAENMNKMQAAMMLPDSATLADVLTPGQMDSVNVFMKNIIGVDFTNPMVMSQMEHFSPGALQTQLAMLMFMHYNKGTFDPTKSFDQYFQQQAKEANKPVGGFETMDFQIKMLLQSTPIKRQVEQLMCLVGNEQYNEMVVTEIVKAYYAQDMVKIKAAIDEKLGNSCDDTQAEEDRIINNRNADWAKKIPAIISAKPTFIEVGAAHLPGDKGVLSLLRSAGYIVEGVK